MRIENLRSMTSTRLTVIAGDTTLRNAAAALANPHIGLLVVCDGHGRAEGVVTKSDIVRHLMLVGVVDLPAAALMSRDVVSCRVNDDLHATWQEMAAKGLQNIPVLDANSRAVGVLDIRDALKVLLEQEEYQERLLFNYVAGVGYQ